MAFLGMGKKKIQDDEEDLPAEMVSKMRDEFYADADESLHDVEQPGKMGKRDGGAPGPDRAPFCLPGEEEGRGRETAGIVRYRTHMAGR